jgi:hypothetical protein
VLGEVGHLLWTSSGCAVVLWSIVAGVWHRVRIDRHRPTMQEGRSLQCDPIRRYRWRTRRGGAIPRRISISRNRA